MTDRFGFKPEYIPSAPTQQSDTHFTPQQPPFPHHNYHHHHPPHFPPTHPPHFRPPPDTWNPPHFHPPPPNYPPGPPSYPHGPPQSCCPPNYPAGSFPSNYPPPPGPPDGSYVVKGYYWVATNARQGVPVSAVRGGVDQDGTQIYVGRAHHEGDWIPAKVIPEKDVAYVAYGGKEHAKSEFQVLCEQTFDWIPVSGSNIPPEAVVGGQTSDGEPLYVGRVHHAGSHTVGKVQPSHGTCYIPFGGEELGFADYEILVLRG